MAVLSLSYVPCIDRRGIHDEVLLAHKMRVELKTMKYVTF
jgi:hypothetical protein